MKQIIKILFLVFACLAGFQDISAQQVAVRPMA